MASKPVQPLIPNALFVDKDGKLSREGYEYLKNMETLVNKLRQALIDAAIPIP